MAAVADISDGSNELPNVYQRATEAAKYVRSKLPVSISRPQVAVVCGSGLGGIADTISDEDRTEISYAQIPHFPQTTGEA